MDAAHRLTRPLLEAAVSQRGDSLGPRLGQQRLVDRAPDLLELVGRHGLTGLLQQVQRQTGRDRRLGTGQ